jgi:hypothetical protein
MASLGEGTVDRPFRLIFSRLFPVDLSFEIPTTFTLAAGDPAAPEFDRRDKAPVRCRQVG